MKTECPHDGHGRSLIVTLKRLTCWKKECACVECHIPLTEPEMKAWVGPES